MNTDKGFLFDYYEQTNIVTLNQQNKNIFEMLSDGHLIKVLILPYNFIEIYRRRNMKIKKP